MFKITPKNDILQQEKTAIYIKLTFAHREKIKEIARDNNRTVHYVVSEMIKYCLNAKKGA